MEQAVYRIIDANFNRAREALRVMEEFCRFALNSQPLSARAKQLRHELCGAIGKLDSAKLIANRDALADVGVGQAVPNQLKRGDLYDCFTAAAKRATEALRALAEAIQTIDSHIVATIENLRYKAYTLEKDIVIYSDTNAKFSQVKLYIIISTGNAEKVLSLVKDCAAGGADCIQLRAKGLEDNKLFELADNFVKACRQAGVITIINDRVDIAVASGADGVHLGQNDLPIAQARKLCMSPLIIGKSTHSIEQLQTAIEDGPAYVGLGPVFTTETKPTAAAVGTEYVSKAVSRLNQTAISTVAIGGITTENAEQVLATGVKSIAVCSAITRARDVKKGCEQLKAKIKGFGK